jgi:hypothetical protein
VIDNISDGGGLKLAVASERPLRPAHERQDGALLVALGLVSLLLIIVSRSGLSPK